MLANYGAHTLDQVLDLTGRDLKRVFCQRRLVASCGDAEDVVKILFETRAGQLGEIDVNQASATSPFHLQAWGTLGCLASDGKATLRLRHVKGGRLPPPTLDRSLASAGRRYPSGKIAFAEKEIPVNPRFGGDVYDNLARAIRQGEPVLVDPAETLTVMRVMETCRRQGAMRWTPAPRRKR